MRKIQGNTGLNRDLWTSHHEENFYAGHNISSLRYFVCKNGLLVNPEFQPLQLRFTEAIEKTETFRPTIYFQVYFSSNKIKLFTVLMLSLIKYKNCRTRFDRDLEFSPMSINKEFTEFSIFIFKVLYSIYHIFVILIGGLTGGHLRQ